MRVSPCAVLYSKMLDSNEFCTISVIDTDCEKYSLACFTNGFLVSAFSAIIIQAIRERWNVSTLRNAPLPTLNISTAWLKCSSIVMPLLPATLMALSITFWNFQYAEYPMALQRSREFQYSLPLSSTFRISSNVGRISGTLFSSIYFIR